VKKPGTQTTQVPGKAFVKLSGVILSVSSPPTVFFSLTVNKELIFVSW
jgi:hypothetical protein